MKSLPSSDARSVLQTLAPLFASAFEGEESGHSKEACVDPLTAYFECVCSHVPLVDWPPIFVPRLQAIPIFGEPFEPSNTGSSQSVETVESSQLHSLAVLAEMDALADRPTLTTFATPRKRRHSEMGEY